MLSSFPTLLSRLGGRLARLGATRTHHGPLGQTSDTPPYRDPSQPIEVRIRDLIGRLTLEEKAQQLNHLNKGLPRLGVPAWGGWSQTLHGVCSNA